jgi:hypothetical protein
VSVGDAAGCRDGIERGAPILLTLAQRLTYSSTHSSCGPAWDETSPGAPERPQKPPDMHWLFIETYWRFIGYPCAVSGDTPGVSELSAPHFYKQPGCFYKPPAHLDKPAGAFLVIRALEREGRASTRPELWPIPQSRAVFVPTE